MEEKVHPPPPLSKPNLRNNTVHTRKGGQEKRKMLSNEYDESIRHARGTNRGTGKISFSDKALTDARGGIKPRNKLVMTMGGGGGGFER